MKNINSLLILITNLGCYQYNIDKDSYVKDMDAPILTLDEYRDKTIVLIDSISCRAPQNTIECIEFSRLYTTGKRYSDQIILLSNSDISILRKKMSMLFYEHRGVIYNTLEVLLGHEHSSKYDIYVSRAYNANSFYFVKELEELKNDKKSLLKKKRHNSN